jgi:hypothetical protein
MVRCQLEHCSTVWSPSSTTAIEKLESLQKRGIKWILNEEYSSYSPELYYIRCKELNLLPIKFKLIMKDLKLFHDIVYQRAPIDLPYYLSFHSGSSRLRSSHLDEMSIVSEVNPKITRNYIGSDVVSSSLAQFSNTYFYRTMNNWNALPLNVRKELHPKIFEYEVSKWLWNEARPIPP